MWCQHCQQDVPATGLASQGVRRCIRCMRESLPLRDDTQSRVTDDSPKASAAHDLSELIGERALQKVRDLGRSIERLSVAPAVSLSPQWRLDASHIDVAPQPAHQSVAAVRSRGRRRMMGQMGAWILTVAGSLVLAIGGGMIARGLVLHSQPWWNAGIGLAMMGQSLVVLGLIRILAALWSTSRWAAHELITAQKQLASLQHTAEALHGQRDASAASFYASLAREASPHQLVANLRGQLDELVTRLQASA